MVEEEGSVFRGSFARPGHEKAEFELYSILGDWKSKMRILSR